ncbi:hypothetical protein OHB53_18175 [Streptomyces sp. NBC_00056]|uniref:TRADD-N-associated membrane domain-containing protein n=1 Tax=Streptomyces sp. NBC_00056 TaxID=2975633 RepID=UPI00324C9B67
MANGSVTRSALARQALRKQHPDAERNLRLWRESKEYTDWLTLKRSFAKVLVYSAAPMIWVAVAITPFTLQVRDSTWPRTILLSIQVAIFFGALIIVLIGTFGYMAARRAFDDRIRQISAAATEEAVERLRESARIKLADLYVINRRQLDEYQAVSIAEQHSAFRNAQIASAIGFIFLVVGVGLSFGADTPAATYTSAGLAGLGALLSGFISKVFFTSYITTTNNLRLYYTEPFRTGQILTAERIACLDDQEIIDKDVASQLRQDIVARLLRQLTTPFANPGGKGKGMKNPNAEKGAGGDKSENP